MWPVTTEENSALSTHKNSHPTAGGQGAGIQPSFPFFLVSLGLIFVLFCFVNKRVLHCYN